MDSVIKDVRFAVRSLMKRPGFTAVVVLTLALGIGANTAIFSVVYSVLLKTPPFPRADRMVLPWGDDRAENDVRSQVSHTDITDYRAQNTTFESITTFNFWTPLISGTGEPARVSAAFVGDVMLGSVQTQRFSMFVLAAFATLALALASVGIYGVMSYVVAQRTHEIGICIALGAGMRNILRLILGNALWLAGAGILLGAAGAFALTRLMKSLLFGVAPTDLLTFVVVCVGLGVVALVAAYLPARRATKVDSLVALRKE